MGESTSRLSTRLRRAPTRYVPTHLIASGGMAEVWKGTAYFENGETHPVALKRVLPALASQDVYRSMFEDEARLGMHLRHHNIVQVYDAREAGGTLIMVMELVDGTSLKGMLDRAHARGACMPVATALLITRELASALAYAHQAKSRDGQVLNVIHRDVSPHNLLLSKEGAVKLADFGLADAAVHRTQLGGGMMGGKLGYLAPELIDQQPSTPQIDVFAAGIVLWEMLCGKRLFHRGNDLDTVRAVARCDVPPPSSINPRVPREVDQLVAHVLARAPKERIPGAKELEARINALLLRLDPRVGRRDISLLVGLHLATEPPPSQTADAPAQLIQELDALAAASGDVDFGASPLDPDQFGRGRRRL